MKTKPGADIDDYLEANGDATKRTRNIIVILVIANVISFSAYLNFLDNSWMALRLRAMNDINSPHITNIIGPPPQDAAQLNMYREHYSQLYSAMLKTYVDNALIIRVPFFGVAIDAYDLNLLGGLAFFFIMTLLRFSLSRELDNLTFTFKESQRHDCLASFYYRLAIRQILIFPHMPEKKQSGFLTVIPKLLCLLPLFIYTLEILTYIGTEYQKLFMNLHHAFYMIAGVLLWVFIAALAFMCFRRWQRIDKIWNLYWDEIQKEGISSVVMETENATQGGSA